jgi:hypothetical protein
MGVPGSANLMLFGGAQAYEIDQSLRFDGSAYLSRSLGTTSSSWTVSFWTKTALNDSNDGYWFNTSQAAIYMDSSSGAASDRRYKFRDATSGSLIVSNAVIRDPSAWYHVVYKCDGSNRRLYINNSLDAGFTYSGSTTLSGSCAIGAYYTGSGSQLEGYIAEFHFVDGSALDPSSFAKPDPITGAWIPKRYTGSYGTNGFYLKFDPTATNGIGHDHSGNGNNFTATGFTTSGTGTDVMSDTPTTNYATANPLLKTSQITLSEGNLQIGASSADYGIVSGTIGMSSGKWYWECTTTSTGTGNVFGIVSLLSSAFSSFTSANRSQAAGFWGVQQGFSPRENGSAVSGTAPSGTVAMFAVDVDAQKYWYGVDGTWWNSGDPAAGTNATSSNLTAGQTWHPYNELRSTTPVHTMNFGQRAFAYTPPTGYKALNTANLPEPTIKDGGKYFNTVLYTGNGSSTRAITGAGFSPDFVWIKSRSNNENNNLYDAVRGATNFLMSNSTSSDQANAATLKSFDSDGFTVGDAALVNWNTWTYAAWCWDAGGTGSSNNAGTITSTVSANASAGFSIVTYTGTGSAATVGHGLGVAPSMIIVKNRNYAGSWAVYHSKLTSAAYYLILNSTAGQANTSNMWNSTAPTSTVFSLGDDAFTNRLNDPHVAYCFSEVAGYSKFGSYTGNGSSDGPFVHTGFKIRFLLLKKSTTGVANGNWYLLDATRNEYNPVDKYILPNSSAAEGTTTAHIDFLSNGFKVRTTNTDYNESGQTYIFAAFAELPFKYSTAR